MAIRLIALCVALSPDLVVMRADQRTRFLDQHVGATIDLLITAWVALFLVLRRAAQGYYHLVIVATDVLDAAQGISCAAHLLPKEARLVRVAAILPQMEQKMRRIGTKEVIVADYADTLVCDASARLQDIAAGFDPRPDIRVLRGNPARTLVRATRMTAADLIVVGPIRSGPIRRFVAGSVIRRLLNDGACDILVCTAAR